jgi:hypothetical protein
MRIQIKDTSKKESILVRRISWRQRCEEQLNKIIDQLNNIKSNMEKDMSRIKDYAEQVYGEEFPDLSKEKQNV